VSIFYQLMRGRPGAVIASPPPRCGRSSRDAGLDPAPRRSAPSWCQFLTGHAKAVLAVDFVHGDTGLLRRIYALIAVEHGSRRTHLVGVTAHPSGAWTAQAARNPLMDLTDRATTIKFLLRTALRLVTGCFTARWCLSRGSGAAVRTGRGVAASPGSCSRFVGCARA